MPSEKDRHLESWLWNLNPNLILNISLSYSSTTLCHHADRTQRRKRNLTHLCKMHASKSERRRVINLMKKTSQHFWESSLLDHVKIVISKVEGRLYLLPLRWKHGTLESSVDFEFSNIWRYHAVYTGLIQMVLWVKSRKFSPASSRCIASRTLIWALCTSRFNIIWNIHVRYVETMAKLLKQITEKNPLVFSRRPIPSSWYRYRYRYRYRQW